MRADSASVVLPLALASRNLPITTNVMRKVDVSKKWREWNSLFIQPNNMENVE